MLCIRRGGAGWIAYYEVSIFGLFSVSNNLLRGTGRGHFIVVGRAAFGVVENLERKMGLL